MKGETTMRHGRHVKLGHGTGAGYAKMSAAERTAVQSEVNAIKARTTERLAECRVAWTDAVAAQAARNRS